LATSGSLAGSVSRCCASRSGFGRPLLIWRGRGPDFTEYWLSAIPLGGYVKMLDEREGPVAQVEQHRAFNQRPIWQRIAVLLAGPAFNFLFAIVAYWVMFSMGVPGTKAVIGAVVEDSVAARAGLEAKRRDRSRRRPPDDDLGRRHARDLRRAARQRADRARGPQAERRGEETSCSTCADDPAS
jgi:hypothetical protein